MKIDKLDESESELSILTIGFAGELTNLQSAHPGWNAWSVAYHGDDGKVYEEISRSELLTEKTYGYECTVGCEIDYKSEEYLFTLGGKVIFRRASKVISRKLYPCVSHRDASAKIKVNFGESDFLWEGAKDLAPEDLDNTMPPPPPPQRSSTVDFRSRSRSRERNLAEILIREPSRERRGSLVVEDDDRTRRRVRARSGILFRDPSPIESPRSPVYDSDSDTGIVYRIHRSWSHRPYD